MCVTYMYHITITLYIYPIMYTVIYLVAPCTLPDIISIYNYTYLTSPSSNLASTFCGSSSSSIRNVSAASYDTTHQCLSYSAILITPKEPLLTNSCAAVSRTYHTTHPHPHSFLLPCRSAGLRARGAFRSPDACDGGMRHSVS